MLCLISLSSFNLWKWSCTLKLSSGLSIKGMIIADRFLLLFGHYYQFLFIEFATEFEQWYRNYKIKMPSLWWAFHCLKLVQWYGIGHMTFSLHVKLLRCAKKYMFHFILWIGFLLIYFVLISLIIFSVTVIVCVPLSCSFRQNAPIYWCYKLPVGLASAPYENLFLTMRPTYWSGKGVPITTSPSGKVPVAAAVMVLPLFFSVCR